MKICVAQIRSEKGNIKANIQNHLKWIELAVSEKTDMIVFPELSLSGYEPELAKDLATDQNDERLNVFQDISDANKIAIGVGLPIQSEVGILIGMVIFQPNQPRQTYFKQILHPDEKPYFVEGSEHTILSIKDRNIALAICYESLQPQHAKYARQMGADIYLASVAKSQTGIDKAYEHFPKIAEQHSIPVLMANCIGFCDNYLSAGQTSIWDTKGIICGQMDSQGEGLLIYDTVSKTTRSVKETKESKM
ncbi:carbon-nitrogen hydrolase family protein [Arenibacter palladensis]|uniref:carbon-nitrogen hydrolase family protein n=1 Tax=Arenibacter palladensis TaxID=237373 RepID=UPI0026E3195D|nr:carbon-nitrogen hydrolase family protein [Arenibacter palladensis]MDO6602441.1 carbon-nitrogen hydrolase family protein [Arenibacter palladensis]